MNITTIHHYIGYDDKEKGKYCIIKVNGATDTIVARGFKSISSAKQEAKTRGIKLYTNPYLKQRRSRK